jgi:hypothetical protein
MLSSKRERFIRSKEDRMPDVSFFRQLHEAWHPITRLVIFEEHLAASGRHSFGKSAMAPRSSSGKNGWTPWLWVGS